jgi:nanoRNase/pAp phosphatase (c-di-AMP/oligoRNAs hydrolase)
MEERPTMVLSLPEDYSARRRSATERRVQQIVEQVEGKNNLLVLMHNDPDPDAIASARAMEELLRIHAPATPVTLGHGGIIGRSENRTMASLIMPHGVRIPQRSAAEEISAYDGVMLVDTQPIAANHLLWNTDFPGEEVLAAIDHHPPRRSRLRAKVHDVRPEVGASATILCEYLAVADVPIDAQLATALFYGIKSDTLGLSRHTSDLDIWAYSTLRHLISTDLLNRIEHVQVPRTYFRNISDALANTTIYSVSAPAPVDDEIDDDEAEDGFDADHPDSYRSDLQRFDLDIFALSRMLAPGQPGSSSALPQDQADEAGENGDDPEASAEVAGDIAVSLLFDMQRPDMVAEVADLLMRMENVSWVVCLGIYEDLGVMSVRAADSNAKAGRLVRIIAGRNGSAGGHNTMAGGRIHLPNKTPAERIAELHALVPRFLKELGAGDDVGVPLLKSK